MQPVVPIYDIGGNFASGKASGLGNNTNPLKYAWARKDDRNTNDRNTSTRITLKHVSMSVRMVL